jgi:glycosyltransferase involved in cell wall biosynthesis
MIEEIIPHHKFSERSLSSKNIVTQLRIQLLKGYNFEVKKHDHVFDQNKPVFTLVVTVYDSNLTYIQKALASCIHQTYTNVEFIIVDNGCSGSFKEILYQTFLDHSNIKLVRFQEHLYNPSLSDPYDPIPNLWNSALYTSEGDYIYFLSCDDILSKNYCEKMERLFHENITCVSASPSIVSINDFDKVNIHRSEYYSANNKRERYTPGLLLAEAYMEGKNVLSFPGGLFSIKSGLVIENGGFDSHNDLSQLFKYAVMGDHGFDPTATLYWRHHNEQANKKQKLLGLVYYKRSIDWTLLYDIDAVNTVRFGPAYARKFHDYFKKKYQEEAYFGLLDAFSYGGKRSGLRAIKKLLGEAKGKKQTNFIFYTLLKLSFNLPIMYLKKIARKIINKIRFETFTSAPFLRQLIKQVRKNRLHLSEINNYGGIEFSYIEYATHVKFAPLSLLKLTYESYEKMFEKSNWIKAQVEANSQLLQLYDTNNHYNLFTELGRQYKAKNILEIGTASGISLYSWLKCESIQKVNTFDLLAIDNNQAWFRNPVMQETVNQYITQEKKRWEQFICDLADPQVFKSHTDIILSSDIIFIDGPHNGDFERALLANILSLRNESEILLIFDDIILSPMVEFWNNLPLPKLDISFIGHQSGTGLALLVPYSKRHAENMK